MRRNPPLSQHMAEDDLRAIARELAQRLYDDPSEGAEFVRDCLRVVTSGLGDRQAEGEYEQKEEIGTHLHQAWRHLNEALALMHPRKNPYDFASPEEFVGLEEGAPVRERFPHSTEIQSLAFSKQYFTEKKAKAWADKHGFRYGKVDEKPAEFRIRQHDPALYDPDTFRSKEIALGVRAIIGMPLESGSQVEFSPEEAEFEVMEAGARARGSRSRPLVERGRTRRP